MNSPIWNDMKIEKPDPDICIVVAWKKGFVSVCEATHIGNAIKSIEDHTGYKLGQPDYWYQIPSVPNGKDDHC